MAAKIYRKAELRWPEGKLPYGADPDACIQMAHHELRLLSQFDHPNIIKPIEAFEDEHKIFFIIDDLQGNTLNEKILLFEENLSEPEVAQYTAFLVSIVKYLHNKKVILRNLRPEGIWIDGTDVKLLDLSLALEEEEV